MSNKSWKEYSQELGQNTFELIQDLVLKHNEAVDISEDYEDIITEIQEYPLSLSVATRDFVSLDKTENGLLRPDSYEILLSTGGPASRIVGSLYSESPITAKIQVQDWFELWTDFNSTKEQNEIILQFASIFYFGG